MCLICVEYYFNRMTKDEVNKALPEMVMFAKTEEEKKHFKKLQNLSSEEELANEAKEYVLNHSSNENLFYRATYKAR